MDEILANAYIKGASDLLQGKIEGMPKVVIIPDNATNGDMIKAMFPNGKVIDRDGDLGYEILIEDGYSFCSWFDGLWWNSPYERGEINEDSN